MSNLELGCKAMIVGGRCEENIGKIVTVGNFIGDPSCGFNTFSSKDYWEVNQKILFLTAWMKYPLYEYFCSGKTLRRIDDHDTILVKSKKELVTTL